MVRYLKAGCRGERMIPKRLSETGRAELLQDDALRGWMGEMMRESLSAPESRDYYYEYYREPDVRNTEGWFLRVHPLWLMYFLSEKKFLGSFRKLWEKGYHLYWVEQEPVYEERSMNPFLELGSMGQETERSRMERLTDTTIQNLSMEQETGQAFLSRLTQKLLLLALEKDAPEQEWIASMLNEQLEWLEDSECILLKQAVVSGLRRCLLRFWGGWERPEPPVAVLDRIHERIPACYRLILRENGFFHEMMDSACWVWTPGLPCFEMMKRYYEDALEQAGDGESQEMLQVWHMTLWNIQKGIRDFMMDLFFRMEGEQNFQQGWQEKYQELEERYFHFLYENCKGPGRTEEFLNVLWEEIQREMTGIGWKPEEQEMPGAVQLSFFETDSGNGTTFDEGYVRYLKWMDQMACAGRRLAQEQNAHFWTPEQEASWRAFLTGIII